MAPLSPAFAAALLAARGGPGREGVELGAGPPRFGHGSAPQSSATPAVLAAPSAPRALAFARHVGAGRGADSAAAASTWIGCLALMLAVGLSRPHLQQGRARVQRNALRGRQRRPLQGIAAQTVPRSGFAARVSDVHVNRVSAAAVATEDVLVKEDAKQSPLESSDQVGGEKPKLALTWENVEDVLDELRPYLQSDGGDCRIVDIDGPVVRLELQGACSSCSASSVTLKMGIERTLMSRIPEISEVVEVQSEHEALTGPGLEEVLDGIRPFLQGSGGSVALAEFVDGAAPRVVLKMTGPPLNSTAVRVELTNRVRRRFPVVQQVDIVAGME